MPNNVMRNNQKVVEVSWEKIESHISKVTSWIKRQGFSKVAIYGIPRGGTIPAVILTHQLENLGIGTRFAADINHLLPHELHNLIILDEICDSGDTFKVLKQLFPFAKTVSLYCRDNAGFKPDYYSETIIDAWLRFPWESKNENS